ncbi:MAG: hypothetical protein ACREYE_30580 [Gammaproteobacteria bacterium]
MKIIKASEFKAKCLQLMNEVFRNGWASQRCCPATLWWMVRLNLHSGLGYWKGPEFRIWARPASRNRIFNEIIQKAGRETLTGGIKRSVSGSSETIKYRW